MSDTNRARRLAFAVVPLAAAALIVPGIAMAAVTTDATASKMAGCLKGGVLTNVAQAGKPAKRCKNGAVKVVWNVKGPKGATGAKGAKGATGAKGAKGDKGDSGLRGIQGLVGAKGDKGDKGDTGLQGIQGLVGAKGDTGSSGLQGIQGLVGAAGADGADGVSDLEVVKNVVSTGGVGGLGNPVSVACPTGKMVLNGGLIPSATSLSGLDPLALVLGALPLASVTTLLSSAPVPAGNAWSMLTPLTAKTGDTFYAVCVTATSAG